MYRSMLYVPATNERFIAKAKERGADAIILDLEDSIPVPEKPNARAALGRAVPACRGTGSDVLVRVNRPIRWCIPDVEAAVAAGADAILLPKAESAEHVRLIAEAIESAEAEFKPANMVKLLLIIEDPAAVMDARAIISAHPRVVGARARREARATAPEAQPKPAHRPLFPRPLRHRRRLFR